MNEPRFLAMGTAGKALAALAKRFQILILFFIQLVIISLSFRYLTPPATSTAVERLFSAAGMILESMRNKLAPEFVDKILFLREAFLLGICQMSWK